MQATDKQRHLRGLDEASVLRDDAAQVAAALLDVAQDAPREAQVVVRVDIDLRVAGSRATEAGAVAKGG